MKRNTIFLFFSLFCVASLSTGCRTFLYGKNGTSETENTPTEVSPAKPEEVVIPIEKVGTPGTYQEYVIPAEGVPTASLVVETEGLKGYTGAHVSAPAPVPDSEPMAKSSSSSGKPKALAGGSVYTVKNGDILGRIARAHGVTVRAIMEANSLKSADRIRVGQKLSIPAASAVTKKHSGTGTAKVKKALPARDGYLVYTIQNGDILGRIAIRHHTTQKAIREANPGMNPDRIRVGQQLYIPVAGAMASKAAPVPEVKPMPDKTATVSAPTPKVAPVPPVQTPKPADDESVDVLTGFDL